MSSSSFVKDLGTRKQREAKRASAVCFSDQRSAGRRSEKKYRLDGKSRSSADSCTKKYVIL
jgi:hypothetical protein